MKKYLLASGWVVTAIAAIIFARTDSDDWLRNVALALVVFGAGLMLKSKE